MNNKPGISTVKDHAVEFLKMVVSGHIDEAYTKYVDMQGKHHNVFFRAGFPILKQAMIENHTQFPVKKFTVKNVVADGDMVAVHSHIVLKPDEPGMTTVHIFRFNGGKIIEMWDIGQEIPPDSPNQDGPF
jgi:predicted SnoaL-like aldol condensation-catalyzing enzyme